MKQIHLTIEHYPESWKKRARAGEDFRIPGTSSFDAYIKQMDVMDPAFAHECAMEFVKSFKTTYDHLESYEGKKRAEKAFQEIGKKMNRGLFRRKLAGAPPPSCTNSCSSCCTILVTATDCEAEAVVDHLRERNIKLDRELTLKQSGQMTDEEHVDLPWDDRVCPILGPDGNCRAYEARPLVCRKFLVASPAWMCDTRLSKTTAFIIEPAVEGAVAAVMALDKPSHLSDHNLPNQLLRLIPENDPLWIKKEKEC